jgi:hypothetical protein
MREPGIVRWLVASVALSVLLTVLLNIAVRAFPGVGHRIIRRLAGPRPSDVGVSHVRDRQVRIFIPWKAMILASVILTVVVNLLL